MNPFFLSAPAAVVNEDMKKLIDVAAARHPGAWPLTPETVRTLLLLLYGTGLRISEALKLNLVDFDRISGVLTIRETKFFKSRFVPVGSDLPACLMSISNSSGPWPA
jgi:integrase/recombinase XerD